MSDHAEALKRIAKTKDNLYAILEAIISDRQFFHRSVDDAVKKLAELLIKNEQLESQLEWIKENHPQIYLMAVQDET